ncbi:MAG: S-adenosyl-l-methionine hydroxide adenosyltransferase family protein [Desulfobacteraceae bacterium]
MTNPIVLITDFGTKDPYAAVMKGVLLSADKNLNIIDATHEISSHNTGEASVFLSSVIEWYPEGTVFICVVDPGVGSCREILVLKTLNRIITAPDNGIVSDVVKKYGFQELYTVSKKNFDSKKTFDGRDIFAPVGAALAEKGTDLFFLEKASEEKIVLNEYFSEPETGENYITGMIFTIDKFGNLITNISKKDALRVFRSLEKIKVYADDIEIERVVSTYSSGVENSLVALWNSSGLLEIACVNSSAYQKIGNVEKVKVFL